MIAILACALLLTGCGALSCCVVLATTIPRHSGTATSLDLLKQVGLLFGDLLLIPYYATTYKCRCDVYYDASYERNRKFVSEVPLLHTYQPTCWLINHWICFIWMIAHELYRWVRGGKSHCSSIVRELIPVNGGLCALDWCADGESLPSSAPVLFIAPTLMGDGNTQKAYALSLRFTAHGWRCVTFVKYGGGQFNPVPLPNFEPTCLLSYDHIRKGLEKVREQYPNSFLAICGGSAGGNWVRHYCAAAGDQNVADAAACLDGGWSWEVTVREVDKHNPVIGKVMGGALARSLLDAAKRSPYEAPAWLDVARLTRARDESWAAVMEEAHCKHAKCDLHTYFATHSDRKDLQDRPQRSSIPLLILASYGDGCCPSFYWIELDKIHELPKTCPNIFVTISAIGPHVNRPTGASGSGCYFADTILQFFSAAKNELDSTSNRSARRSTGNSNGGSLE